MVVFNKVIENLLHGTSVEKTDELYSVLSMMGLERQNYWVFLIGDNRFFGKDKQYENHPYYWYIKRSWAGNF